jgi:PKD repeat protein
LTCPGSELSFDAGASSDADGSIERWVWDFGDGATAEGRTVRHRYTEPGDYRVRLQVRDDSGSNCASAVDTARVTVNSRPIAKASGDRTGWVGGAHDRVALDAGGSSDPDGGPLSFVWDLGDGLSATGETIRHGYLQPGSYTVRLSAMDGSGLPCGTGTDELGLELRPRPR